MAERDYIELKTSNLSMNLKFSVLKDGRNRALSKKATVKETMDGGLDVTMGGVHQMLQLVIRVRQQDDRSGYGELADLEQFYKLNNPGGTPSNIITYVDHRENSYTAYMIGDFRESLMGCKLEGTNALYLAQVTLRIIPGVGQDTQAAYMKAQATAVSFVSACIPAVAVDNQEAYLKGQIEDFATSQSAYLNGS